MLFINVSLLIIFCQVTEHVPRRRECRWSSCHAVPSSADRSALNGSVSLLIVSCLCVGRHGALCWSRRSVYASTASSSIYSSVCFGARRVVLDLSGEASVPVKRRWRSKRCAAEDCNNYMFSSHKQLPTSPSSWIIIWHTCILWDLT